MGQTGLTAEALPSAAHEIAELSGNRALGRFLAVDKTGGGNNDQQNRRERSRGVESYCGAAGASSSRKPLTAPLSKVQLCESNDIGLLTW